ncbi:MAG: nitroreductase [Desulfuromonadales bacterium]|nr:nitroreductase [Desulfuromonadales bacterium]
MDERIEKLLQFAVTAPSGDNCQPWKFAVNDRQIKVFNVPGKDTSLYNFQQMASLVAHGALLENILIAAPSLGFMPKIEYFPDSGNPDLVATVELGEGERFEDPLLPWMLKRCTNRKKYDGIPLTEEQENALVHAPYEVPKAKVRLETDPAKVKSLAAILANNDRLVFENSYLHNFLFEHIRWTDEEARQTSDGLDIKTLELKTPDSLVFKFFKYWPVVEKLNRVGLSKMVAKQAEKLCLSASGVGIITVQGNSDEDFLLGGRVMQRVWLEATRLGLSFQPLAGIAFLMQRVSAGATGELAPQQVKLISDVGEKVSQLFYLDQEEVVMFFRVGRGGPPSARSLRKPLDGLIKS